MSNVIINNSNLTNIANAIRNKNGSTNTYKPSEMANAINNISISEDLSTELNEQNNLIESQETTIDDIVLALQGKSAGIEIDLNSYINTSPTGTCSGSYSYITRNIKKIPELNLTGMTNMRYFFVYCSILKEVEGIMDIGFSTNNTGMFGTNGASAPTLLETIKLKNVCANLDVHYCVNLTKESLLYLINNAQTVESGTLTLGSTLLEKLTSDEIAIATSKGWTIE